MGNCLNRDGVDVRGLSHVSVIRVFIIGCSENSREKRGIVRVGKYLQEAGEREIARDRRSQEIVKRDGRCHRRGRRDKI